MTTAPESSRDESGLTPPTPGNQYLTFVLGNEEYGIEILRVQGIQGLDGVTEIPNTPGYVLGVINLRGTVVPIVDLRLRFDMEPRAYGPTTVVIVVRVEGGAHARTVGLVVDAVSDVTQVAGDDVRPAPDFGSGIDTCFVRGLARSDDKLLILLDVDALINTGVMEEPEAAAEGAPA